MRIAGVRTKIARVKNRPDITILNNIFVQVVRVVRMVRMVMVDRLVRLVMVVRAVRVVRAISVVKRQSW